MRTERSHSAPSAHSAFSAPLASAALWALALSAAACAAAPTMRALPHAEAGVVGTPADVKIQTGTYGGYEVYRRCRTSWPSTATVSVIGTGAHEMSEATPAEREALRQGALEALGPLRSIHATAFGTPCQGDRAALQVLLYDWHEVDAAVERLGQWMASEQLRGEIMVLVLPTFAAK